MQQVIDQAVIAENLRALKGRQRVSDADIAAGTGMSRNQVNDRMLGRTRSQIDDVAKFAKFFGVSLEQIIEAQS